MTIPELIDTPSTAFSFEVLPPLKGNGIDGLRRTIERLREFDPKYINITHHRAEYVYRERPDGLMERLRTRRRPGTVAVAAALQREFGIPLVPHLLCSGYTREETEYQLLDMQILGIENLLLLRGDKAKEDPYFRPVEGDTLAPPICKSRSINSTTEPSWTAAPCKRLESPFSMAWLAILRSTRKPPIWNPTFKCSNSRWHWARNMA